MYTGNIAVQTKLTKHTYVLLFESAVFSVDKKKSEKFATNDNDGKHGSRKRARTLIDDDPKPTGNVTGNLEHRSREARKNKRLT